ncbi:hypothetical protein N9W34_00065 [Rickettsiales bacterium]|nr:hypothetical protein [Rickettsiales bacterium]
MKKLLTTTAIILTISSGIAAQQAYAYIYGDNEVIVEDIVIAYSGEPANHFYHARESYLEDYRKIAADDVRKGAKYVLLESESAAGEGKTALLSSYKNLLNLAHDMERSEHVDIHRINKVFTHALYNMSHHQYIVAKESWAKKEAYKAGEAISAAANNLRHAAAWAEVGLEADGVAVVNEARSIGKSLKEGSGWTEKQVGKGLENFGGLVTKVGKELEK